MTNYTTANGWSNAVITEQGRALLAKLTQGNTLNITRAAIGTEMVFEDELVVQTDLMSPMQDMTIMSATYPSTGKCALTVSITNADVDMSYLGTQVGIYAEDPDEGEILFFIAQADSEERGVLIAASDETAGYSAEWTFYFQYGQADSVTVVVDPSNTVSREVMEKYVAAEVVEATEDEVEEAIAAALE